MGKICRNRDGNFVIFGDSATPVHCKRKISTVFRGSYNNDYPGKYKDIGCWEYLDGGIPISIENVPEKYLDMTYDSEPRTI